MIKKPKLQIFKLMPFFILSILLLMSCKSRQQSNIPAEKKRELVNALYNQQLYAQSVQQYEEYLNNYSLEENELANISYMVANIYFERLHDYENALAYYLRIRHLYPESNIEKEANKKIVECLERLRRSSDAQQVIEQTAALDESQKTKTRPGEVIAKIGDREFTTGDMQYELNRLPVYIHDQIKTKEQKIEFIKSIIVQELLYDSAKRKGLDKNKDVREGIKQAERTLMAQKLIEEEIQKDVNIENYSNADVELYYKANHVKYAEKDDKGEVKRIKPFSEVQQSVAQDFIQEKQQKAYESLIERLMKAEKVVIYEQKFN